MDLNGEQHLSDPVQIDGITSVNEQTPTVFALHQNCPNPLNPETRISFSVQRSAPATLRVFNLLGQQVASLFDGHADVGRTYSIPFSGRNIVSGLFFYKLESAGQTAVRKMTLLK